MMEEQEIKRNSWRAWVLAARPKTLSGAAVPVMIGGALAYTDARFYDDDVFSLTAWLLCLLFAFAMQIDANLINDFFDFVNGSDDAATRLGPKRACAQGWVTLDAMKRAIALTTCGACLIGLPLVWWGGLEMVLVGAACVVFAFLYTTWFSYAGLGDVLVLLFFGLVPVGCCYYVQLHTLTWQVLLAALACGLVIDALLIVNNFRDRDNDRAAGKLTLIVRMGEGSALQLYMGVGVAAVILGFTFWLNGHPLATLFPLLYFVLHIFCYLKMKRIWEGRALNACLGETARNIFIYGLCVSIGLLLV